MEKQLCPRCNRSIATWQPVHLTCFLRRTRFVWLFLTVLIAVGVTGAIIIL